MQESEYTSIEFEARGSRLALLFSIYAHNDYEDVGGLIAIAQGIAEDHLEDNDDVLKDCWANSASQYLDAEEFPESVEEIDEELFLSEEVMTWNFAEEKTEVFIYPRGVLPIKQEENLEPIKETFCCRKSETGLFIDANISRDKIIPILSKIVSGMPVLGSIDVSILPEWDQEEGLDLSIDMKNGPSDLAIFLDSIRESVLENGHTKVTFNFTESCWLELCDARMLHLIIDEKNISLESTARKIFEEFHVTQDDQMTKISDGWYYSYSFDDDLDSESLELQLKKLGFN